MTHELYAINDNIRQFGLPELTTYLFLYFVEDVRIGFYFCFLEELL